MTIRDGWPSSLRSRPAQGRSVPGTEFPDSSERRSHAHALTIAMLASRSAARALRRFQPGTPAEVKSFPGDLVSAADRAAEAAIVGVLGRHRPRDAILSEEGRSRLSDSGLLWVIDPIDGTANYLHGAAPWAISVALVDEDGPAVGVVTIPPWRLQYSAVRGLGASLNGVTLAQRTAVDPRGALVSTGLSYRPALRARWLRALSRAVEHVADIRRSGSAAADLCAVAAGLTDGFIELDLSVWDVAAGVLIATEAGCPVWPLERPGAVDVLAACPGLEATLLPILEREHARLLREDRVAGMG